MSQIRMARMAEELREQVSDILRNHLSDPRLQWVSVVRVDLSPDLRHAKLFMSVLGSEADQETSLRVLARARGAIRAELAHRMRLRKVPEILFRADQTIAGSARILEILHELGFTGDSAAPIDEDGEA
jgi:ribosome-binding factor A